jgi:hypothetical protein
MAGPCHHFYVSRCELDEREPRYLVISYSLDNTKLKKEEEATIVSHGMTRVI